MDKIESVEEESIFEQQVGTSLNLTVVSLFDEEQNKWKTIGAGEFGATRNGEDWGAIKTEAMSIDSDLMNAVAVVMRTLNNITVSPEFGQALLDAVKKAEETKPDETNKLEEGQH